MKDVGFAVKMRDVKPGELLVLLRPEALQLNCKFDYVFDPTFIKAVKTKTKEQMLSYWEGYKIKTWHITTGLVLEVGGRTPIGMRLTLLIEGNVIPYDNFGASRYVVPAQPSW